MLKEEIKKTCSKFQLFCRQFLAVGFFLALRQIKRTNIWISALIVFVMFFTFLNLVVVNGILVGLVQGSSEAYRSQYSGDVFVSHPPKELFIKNTRYIVNIIQEIDDIESYSIRYLAGGRVESNYKERAGSFDLPEDVAAEIVGINPERENNFSGLAGLVAEGEYLNEDDLGSVLVGSGLLGKYSSGIPGVSVLGEVNPGDKIKVFVADTVQEVKVKGIVKSKIGEVSSRVYFIDSRLRNIIGRTDLNAHEIGIKLKAGIAPEKIKEVIMASGVSKEDALVQTWEESQGEFFKNLSTTFDALGLAIGLIGVVVASITVFIVVFINSLTKRKYIGILKAIGICESSIEIAYVAQALFYVILGVAFGILLLYGFLVPFVQANPIDFPFSDGILAAPPGQTILRIVFLFLVTALAGYIPARLITKKNTLDSILQR